MWFVRQNDCLDSLFCRIAKVRRSGTSSYLEHILLKIGEYFFSGFTWIFFFPIKCRQSRYLGYSLLLLDEACCSVRSQECWRLGSDFWMLGKTEGSYQNYVTCSIYPVASRPVWILSRLFWLSQAWWKDAKGQVVSSMCFPKILGSFHFSSEILEIRWKCTMLIYIWMVLNWMYFCFFNPFPAEHSHLLSAYGWE